MAISNFPPEIRSSALGFYNIWFLLAFVLSTLPLFYATKNRSTQHSNVFNSQNSKLASE